MLSPSSGWLCHCRVILRMHMNKYWQGLIAELKKLWIKTIQNDYTLYLKAERNLFICFKTFLLACWWLKNLTVVFQAHWICLAHFGPLAAVNTHAMAHPQEHDMLKACLLLALLRITRLFYLEIPAPKVSSLLVCLQPSVSLKLALLYFFLTKTE